MIAGYVTRPRFDRKYHRGGLQLLHPRPRPAGAGSADLALIHFLLFAVLWVVWLGWIVHIWSTIDAAIYKGRSA
ncbi:MAG: hypothetical protein QM754_06805 [Tepidisphaeraceae bacterium]